MNRSSKIITRWTVSQIGGLWIEVAELKELLSGSIFTDWDLCI